MADSDPITWRLALLLQAQLQKVRVTNGYRTDIGAEVLLEETQTPADADVLPTIVDVNLTERAGGEGVNKRQRSVGFTVQAFVPVTLADAKFKAHCVLDDIERVLDQEADTVPKGFRMAKATKAEIDVKPDGLNVMRVTVTGTANYLR